MLLLHVVTVVSERLIIVNDLPLTRHGEVSGMELVRSSRRSVADDDDDDDDTDFSAISSLTSEQHPMSTSLAHRSRASLLVGVQSLFNQSVGESVVGL